jgi:light-regulated signal transduction histidine kinase (bacteriophytochrome)
VRIVHSIIFSIAINDSFAMGSATRDITELDRVEQERARYAADLARSNRDLEQFGYIISHDLQTPLRTVTGFLGLLRSRYGDQLDDRAGGYVDRAIEGAERMKAMIRAMLDLSRVESRGGTLTSVDSGAVLARTLRGLAADLEASGATVTHDPLPAVMADAVQLGQVFQNLIGNALKFRHKDVPPCVHVSAGHSDGMWVFFVQDNGIGLEPEGAARIFEVFQRLHTEEEYPGLGVGLALCRRIVERHGGRIWVASAPGQGASFFFTLHEAPGGDQERPDHPSSPD